MSSRCHPLHPKSIPTSPHQCQPHIDVKMMKSPKFVGDGVRWWSGRAGSWVKPICWWRQFFPQILYFLTTLFCDLPEIINEMSVEKKGAWKSLNLEQVSSSIDIANFASSPHFFRAGFSFKRSFQSCLLNLHFPHCVRWSLPIGKQVWPTLRDPFSTSRWSSSSQSSMRSSPSRWSRFQNVLQANYPQDVFQVKLDRRPLSWSWLKQPKLPTRFFRHHH